MRGARDIFVPGGGNGAGGGVAISASDSSISAGTLSFANGSGVTFGLSGSTITASVAAVGGAQTGISGIIVSDATYTSGTVSFSNAGNITIQSSVNGATQYIKLSGNAAQTNQSAIKGFGVSNTGATAGNTGISTGIDWVVAGSNLITLSQSTAVGGPNTVWVQHPAWLTTAMASNRGSDFVQATAAFAGTNASGTIASNGISVAVAAPIPIGTAVKAVASVGSTGTITRYAPEDHQHAGVAAFAVTNTGNTLGNTRSQVGTLFIAASGGITASQSTAAAGNDTIWLSVAAPVAQTAQTGISGIIVSDATYTSGTVSFSNQANITIGSSVNGATQYIRLSGNAAQTNQSAIKGLGASNTGNTAGNTGLSTGIDWVLAGSNNVTISQSTTAGGPNTLWVSGPTVGGAQTGISGIIVSDATYTSGTVSFSNAGNITIQSSVNGATQYIKLSGNAAQTNQSAIKGLGVSNTGNTLGNTGLSTGIDWVIAGSGAITASQSTAGGGPNTVWMSVAAQTNQSAIKGLGASNTGNTAGNTGISTGIDWVIAGTNNVTVSQSTTAGGPNTLWLSAPNVAAGAVTFSASANSSALGSVIFANSNNITFGLTTGSQITASFGGGGGGIGGGVSTGGNTAGSTGTVTTGNLVFVGSGVISLSQSTGAAGSNATISILAPATSSLVGTLGIGISTNGSTISVSNNPIAHFEPYPLFNALSTTWAPTSSSWYFVPFELAQPISGGRLNFMVAHGSTASILKESTSNFQTNSTGTLSVNFTYARKAALYSVGAGTNSTRLESVWSNQWSLSIDQLVKVASAAGPNMTVSVGATISMMSSLDSAGGVTTSTLGHSSTSAGAVSSIGTVGMTSILSSERNVLSSQLMIPIPFNTTINPGQYYLAHMWITGSTTATTGGVTTANVLSIVNQYAILGNTNTAARIWGQTAATSGSAPFMGVGVYSAGSAAPPATIAFSDLRTFASMQIPYWNYQNSTI